MRVRGPVHGSAMPQLWRGVPGLMLDHVLTVASRASDYDVPKPPRAKVLEFFAGVGLARMGLEQEGFQVVWANDYEPKKHEMYSQNFGGEQDYVVGDIGDITGSQLPQNVDLAWASSPCTDLSLAGNRLGLVGRESSAFYQFIRVLSELGDAKPKIAVLENVVGLATSNGGQDLVAAARSFNDLGYSVDAIVLDARRFLPQSRPRIFIVAAQDVPKNDSWVSASVLRPKLLDSFFNSPSIKTHKFALPEPPGLMNEGLGRVLDKMDTQDPRWWDEERTQKFIQSLSPVQAARAHELASRKENVYRTAYRRTRAGKPTWEIREDDIAGCLRTARGGSSKQAVVEFGADGTVRARWMTGGEYARLMGADDYTLTGLRDSQIHFAFGDAVAVPAVSWLAQNYLMPLHEWGSTAPTLSGDFGTERTA